MEKKVFGWLCFMFLSCLLSCMSEKRSFSIAAEDFFSPPSVTDYKVSPDGKHISYLQRVNGEVKLFIRNIAGDTVLNLTQHSRMNVSVYFWADSKRLVYMQSLDKGRQPHVYAVDYDGKNAKVLLQDNKARLRFVKHSSFGRQYILVAMNKRDSLLFDAYSLNMHSGKLDLLHENPGNIIRWIADEEGNIRMAVAGVGENENLLFRGAGNRFNPILMNDFKTHISLIGFTGHGSNNAYVLSNHERDKTAVVEIDCITGKEKRTMYANDSVDINAVGFATEGHELLYAEYKKARTHRYYFKASEKQFFDRVGDLLPQKDLSVVSHDSLHRKVIIHAYADNDPGTYYLYDKEDGMLTMLGVSNERLKGKALSTTLPFSYKSADSLTIHAYLTMPIGRKPQKLPLVVMPHEGPSSRNYWGYAPEVQFLASRGYAVLQINFRGSKGYGKQFWIAGFKEWGSSIQRDIEGGVDCLVKQGVVDSRKVAIYGRGFGGYCALYGLCFNADRYKCGISRSGFVNLFTYIKSIPPELKTVLQMHYEMIGDPGKEIGTYRAASPIFHSDKIKAPVLLVEDLNNKRGNINETNQFVRKLRNNEAKITYLVQDDLKSELTLKDDIRFYTVLERFLMDNLH